MDGYAHEGCEHYEHAAWDDRFGVEVRREEGRDDVYENSHRQRDEEENDCVKKSLSADANQVFRDLSDRDALRPDRDSKSAEIVNGTNEDCAEDDPKGGREPSPDHGDRGPKHRGQPGDRCVVMTEQDVAVGWNVVDVVAETMRWGLA